LVDQDESQRSQILRLKEQLILVHLQRNRLVDELPVDLVREVTTENARKYAIQNNTTVDEKKPIAKKRPKDRLFEEGATKADVKGHRNTMQEWKQALLVPEDPMEQQNREALRRKRRERQEKRKRRLAQLLGVEEELDHVDEEVELADDDDQKPVAVAKEEPVTDEPEIAEEEDIDPLPLQDQETKEPSLVPAIPHPAHVECPLCQELVPYGSDPDSVLSQHMDTCQRKRTRRSTRARQSTNYSEDLDAFDDGQDEFKPAALRTTRASKRKRTAGTKPPPRPKRYPTTSLALDDLEECFYEDRVDEWIESGLSRMKVMSERDESEIAPGAVVYDGNLRIPAWINNRLFPYQRAGLRWMWELHQQQAGGIV